MPSVKAAPKSPPPRKAAPPPKSTAPAKPQTRSTPSTKTPSTPKSPTSPSSGPDKTTLSKDARESGKEDTSRSDAIARGLDEDTPRAEEGKANGETTKPAEVLTDDGATPEAKGKAVTEILSSDKTDFSKEERARLVDAAMDSGDPEVIKLAREKLTTDGPSIDGALGQIGNRFQERVSADALKAFEDGDKSNPLHTLGELFHVQSLGAEGGEFAGEIDRKKLADKIQAQGNRDSVKKHLAQLGAEEQQKWRQSPEGREIINQQAEYLQSEEFQQKLRLTPPEERDALMQQEIGELALLDPSRAADAGQAMVDERTRQALDRPLESLSHMKPEDRERTLTEFSKQLVGQGKLSTKMARDALGELRKMPASKRAGDVMKQVVQRLGRENAGSDIGGKFQGALGHTLTGLGVLGLGLDVASGRRPWESVDTALSQAAQVTGIAGGLSKPVGQGLARLSGISSDVAKPVLNGTASAVPALSHAPKTMRTLSMLSRVAKGAPIAGDVLATVIDGKNAYNEFQNGNTARGTTYATAAGLGAVATGLGVAALTAGAVNAWNPLGWAALGVGAAATGVGFAASQMDGANEKLVKRHDLFDPAASAYYAMDGSTTDETALNKALQGRSADEMAQVRQTYQERYGRSLRNDIAWDTSGHHEDTLLAMTNGYQNKNWSATRGAAYIENAISGAGTDESAIISSLTKRSPRQLRELKAAYRSRTGRSLESDIRSDTSGNFESALISLLGTAR